MDGRHQRIGRDGLLPSLHGVRSQFSVWRQGLDTPFHGKASRQADGQDVETRFHGFPVPSVDCPPGCLLREFDAPSARFVPKMWVAALDCPEFRPFFQGTIAGNAHLITLEHVRSNTGTSTCQIVLGPYFTARCAAGVTSIYYLYAGPATSSRLPGRRARFSST